MEICSLCIWLIIFGLFPVIFVEPCSSCAFVKDMGLLLTILGIVVLVMIAVVLALWLFVKE